MSDKNISFYLRKINPVDKIAHYNQLFTEYLQQNTRVPEPKNLYEPIDYILKLGGKRIRPILTLIGAEIFGATPEEALPAALAIEIFHNFSLVHDDIMDAAPIRRGKDTVHTKWNTNTGILSGDAMLIQAYQCFEIYDAKLFYQLVKLFSDTALEVCEGQQYDIDFETRNDVSIDEYLKMITYKTSVLVGCAFQMGAIIANQSKEAQKEIYKYGKLLGIAFQIQDDYLDAFGNPETFGKQVGGDIIENKKTYLFLKARELGNGSQKEQLHQLFSNKDQVDTNGKITTIKQIFNESGATEATKKAIQEYTNQAFEVANKLDIPIESKEMLINFGTYLMNRRV